MNLLLAPQYLIPFGSNEWFKASGTTFLLIALVVGAGYFLTHSKKHSLGRFIGYFLLTVAISAHVYLAYVNRWTLQDSLPLHLCGISGLLSGLVLLTRNQMMYECVLYWGLAGATHSLLTPDMPQGGEGYMYFEYYLQHGGIILAALYATIAMGMRPRKNSWLVVFGFSQILMIVVGTANYLIGSNYMFLCERPLVDNPLVIGKWPWYIISFEVAAIVHFLLIYAPFWWINKKKVATEISE
ncbi:MAG: TIGR02206 family membrane protein [Chitinophagales bacterium]|nr:TIGR02206 family membrane protein [Chitinophagales bacterium]